MCQASLSRAFLIIFNVIFIISGCGLVAIGCWMKFDTTLSQYLNAVKMGNASPILKEMSLVLIGIGVIVLLIAIIGCCGALRKSQCCLFLYASFLLIIMLAEIAVGVLAIVYKKKIADNLHTQMQKEINDEYGFKNETTTAYDFLQKELQCCGVSNYTDYLASKYGKVPDSCCKDDGDENCKGSDKGPYFDMGCEAALKKWLSDHSLKLMIIGFCIGAIQIFGFVAACVLRSAYKTTQYEKTAQNIN